MFGDVAMITILVSINTAIMTLVLFMYYIGRSEQEGDCRKQVAFEQGSE